MLGDILIRLAAFAILGFLFLVLMGLWDRYEREAAALGFGGVYEHFMPVPSLTRGPFRQSER